MKRVQNIKDLVIILRPDNENEPMYKWDGGGMREAGNVFVVDILGVLEGLDIVAQAGAENDADVSFADLFTDVVGSGVELIDVILHVYILRVHISLPQ